MLHPFTDLVVVLLSSAVEKSLVDDNIVVDEIADGLDCIEGAKASVADGSRPATAAATQVILGLGIVLD